MNAYLEQGKAGQVLYDLKESDRAWSIADSIIEQCKDSRSIFFGLIVDRRCFR